MIFKPTKNEMLMAIRKMSFTTAASLPMTFKLGDRVIRGIPADFKPTAVKKLVDSNMSETVITGMNDKGLETLRRAVPFQYTDVGLADPAQKQKQHLMFFEWAPYFRAHTILLHFYS